MRLACRGCFGVGACVHLAETACSDLCDVTLACMNVFHALRELLCLVERADDQCHQVALYCCVEDFLIFIEQLFV